MEYSVIYDVEETIGDCMFFSTVTEKVDTFEEAIDLQKQLRDCPIYHNINIVMIGE